MQGEYCTNIESPSIYSFKTNNKINDINNNAYIEVICAYEFIKETDWFLKNKDDLFNIYKNDKLSDFQDLTFENMEKLDYTNLNETTLQENDEICENELDNLNLEELNFNNNTIEKTNIDCIEEIELKNNNKEDIIDKESNSEISDDDSSSLSNLSIESFMSNQSCILAEVYVKLKSIPVQILAMELLEETLTNLIKNNLKKEEWKSILFQICFGLAVAQKHLDFIHNDLHTDNIMFKRNKNYNFNFDLARLGTTIINYIDDYEINKFINTWTIGKNGRDFTRMDDDFSLYVEISKFSNNCLPKNQILKDFFKEYHIKKKDIPENVHIYIY